MQWAPDGQPWSIQAPGSADLNGMMALSVALSTDSTPCSFWGLTPERVGQWLSDPDRALVLAKRGHDVQGIASYVRGGAYQQHLAEVSVAVAPVARRSGMAGALLSHLEDTAAAADIRLLKALIWVQNTPSRRFFEAHAYEHRATLYAEFMSEQFGEIDDCVYYKRLGPA